MSPRAAERRWRLLVDCEGLSEAELESRMDEAGVDLPTLESWRRRAVGALEPETHELRRVGVRLFGSLRVEAESLAEWPHRRCRELVAFLSLRPGYRASRPQLVAALWPDASEEAVERTFHPTLSAARRGLREAGLSGDPVPHENGTWALSPDVDWVVDVVRYRRLLEEGLAESDPAPVVERLEAAWRLRRGAFLEELTSGWVEAERARLGEEQQRLLERLGAEQRALGRCDEALDAFRSLLVEEPLAESIHVAVMEIYAEKGRPDLVRRQFLRLQELLAEIDVEPAEPTQRRVRELLGA